MLRVPLVPTGLSAGQQPCTGGDVLYAGRADRATWHGGVALLRRLIRIKRKKRRPRPTESSNAWSGRPRLAVYSAYS